MTPPAGRDESPEEKADRNWSDVLQELRVVQTGVQLLSGFLLTLPFNDRFVRLDDWQIRLYLALVLVAGLAVAITLTAISVHRRVFGHHVKATVVLVGHRLTQVVIALLAVTIVGSTTLIFSVVVGWSAALLATAVTSSGLVVLLVIVPIIVSHEGTRGQA